MAILDRVNAERWLLVEERTLLSLSEAIGQSGDDAKWQMGVKVAGCGNKKAVDFLTASIRGLDALWPSMNRRRDPTKSGQGAV